MISSTTRKFRKVVKIDEQKCNGCGDCAPSCAEGAIKIINGKARLVADNLCDGLGACLGHCPMGAITVEERLADDFDEKAVHAQTEAKFHPAPAPPAMMPQHAGCPGSRIQMLQPVNVPMATPGSNDAFASSMLRQWPVQLTLLPPQGPIWQNADVLLAADCVPFAYPQFHQTMLAGKTLAIACPKLDDVEPYIDKLSHIFANNSIRSLTVARMEVPCCGGLTRLVRAALERSGRQDLEIQEIVVGISGQLK